MSQSRQESSDGPTQSDAVTIIRYPNRRLYDRSQNKYVTLQDVEDTVRRGRTVIVRDSKSGVDLTRAVLAQIILERYPERMELFPVSLLHVIIRADDLMLGLLRDYARQSLPYVEMLERAAPFNPWSASQERLRAFLTGVPGQERPSSPKARAADVAVDDLLHRIGELERQLGELRAAAGESGPNAPPRKIEPGGG